MKRKTFFLILMIFAVLLSGCAPKIIGKRKHKRIPNCGCELIQPQNQHIDSTVAIVN